MDRISFAEALSLDNKIFLDVRSPDEFKIDHVPQAENIPILDNRERELIGKIYKNQGSIEARKKGVELISPKLNSMINSIFDKTEPYENIIFYCSRGGLRSQSMASFFTLVTDKKIFIIERGYKEFREYLINYFKNFESIFSGEIVVIDGLTGSGKTLILKELSKRLPVIDLENLAKHRGSVFGGVGINIPVSQKFFESQLWDSLQFLGNDTILVEGESKHIGSCVLPTEFYQKMNRSKHIWLNTTDDLRLDVIKSDYLESPKNEAEIIDSILHLKRFIGSDKVDMLIEKIREKDFDFVILFLLKNYYDILYKKGRLKEDKFYKTIYYETIFEGVEQIEEIYHQIKRCS